MLFGQRCSADRGHPGVAQWDAGALLSSAVLLLRAMTGCPERRWDFVYRCGGYRSAFRYAPRRVECVEHGIVVEHIPWSDGKRPLTTAMMGFLARWSLARRLSWRETATIFQTSWESVYRSVEWFVEWGLAHRQLCRG